MNTAFDGCIRLESIDPGLNRYRGYQIQLYTLQIRETIYMVRLLWGQLHRLSQSLFRLFNTQEEAELYLNDVLMRRFSHGYEVVDNSKGRVEFNTSF